MLQDKQYNEIQYAPSELKHEYGKNFHILQDPFLSSLLAKFCRPQYVPPFLNHLLSQLYEGLLQRAVSAEFPLSTQSIQTRMESLHPEGSFQAKLIDPKTRAVTVGIARAGTQPSQTCFEVLNSLLDPRAVRQDHISMNRKTDSADKVIGTDIGGIKIGGDIQDAYVLFPDPMGATGSTLKSALNLYRDEAAGTPKKLIALHLVVTPEYLSSIQQNHPELIVYAIRLDRGLSPAKVLSQTPGTDWKAERGLNDKHYIVPGAGGIGEILNNSYV